MLPGDPASIICPKETCGGTAVLAERWNLDSGPWEFFIGWLKAAASGDFGRSWRYQQGVPVSDMLIESIPNTLLLIAVGFSMMLGGVVISIRRGRPSRFDSVLALVGVMPAVVLALMARAIVEVTFGGVDSYSDTGAALRVLSGGLVLGLADGVFSGAIIGTKGLFTQENQRRYVSVAILRGETLLSNTIPNVAPALVGQLRARTMNLLSGAVIVETIIRVDGLGDLMWGATLLQDFGVVLACATCFAILSSMLLLIQAMIEIGVAIHVRRAPRLIEEVV